MKPPIWFTFGTAAGLLSGAAMSFMLLKESDRRSESEPARDWKDQAAASTMPGRRAYTLPLNNPDMVPTTQATHMQDEDMVLGVLVEGEARAYPWWLTSNYHVVNDTVGETPLLMTLCEVCGGAAAFKPAVPELPGLALSFQISGVGLGTLELVDHQTHSKWRPFLGTAFEGPLTGRTLENLPLLVMTWKDWKERYSSGLVVNGSSQLRARPHGAEAGSAIGDSELPPLFAATANLTDHRLGAHELMLGIMRPGKPYAIPLKHLAPFPGLFVVTLDEKPVLVVREGQLALSAFELSGTTGRTDVSLVSTNPVTFRTPDGRTWNSFGVSAQQGQAAERLPAARSYLTEWYEWVSHSPHTGIVEPSQIASATAAQP